MKSRNFTLLEILLGLALLLLASGFLGIKMEEALVKKRFQSEFDQIRNRCIVCHRLAIAMHADWRGQFIHTGTGWVFKTFCLDSTKVKALPPIQLSSISLFLNKKKIDAFSIDFISTGSIFPAATLEIRYAKNSKIAPQILQFPDACQAEVGHKKKLGPIHPSQV